MPNWLKLNTRLTISLLLILLISVVSGYFLWEIDRHEKALNGQVFLIRPSQEKINKMEQKKQDYWDTLNKFKEQNPQVMTYVNIYKDLKDQSDYNMTDLLFAQIKEPDKIVRSDSYFCYLHLPTELQMTQTGCNKLINSHPESGKLYVEIVNEMRKRFKDAFPNIKETNPPKAQIEQSIKTMYRSMIAIDAIILLCLGLFLYLCKPSKESLRKSDCY